MRTLQDEYTVIHKLLNYIQIEGDVGDKYGYLGFEKTRKLKKLLKDARNALNRLEKQK